MAASTGPASPISAVLVPSVKNNGEAPIAILRVQIISFDVFALDSISVVITFGSQRVTSLVRRRAPIDESIFDLPVFSSMVETRGALLELVVYPRSPLSKSAQMAHSVGGSNDTSRHSAFVGEFGLVLPQWFQRDGNEPIYAFDDVRNYAHQFPLARSQSSATVSTVLTKVGLMSLDSSSQDLWVVYEEILSKSQRATNKLLSLPPVQAVGAFRPGTDPHSPISSAQADGTVQTSEDFEIDWNSTPVDFHLMSERSIMGVVLLQIQGAHGLPEVGPTIPRGSGMDPYIIIKYNDELYRTKVIRQSLDPLFKDRFVLLVHRPIRCPDANTTAQIPESPAVTLSVSNWAKPLGHQHIGDAVLDLQRLIEAAPRPDPETGFYSARALQCHTFSEMDLNVDPKQGGRWNLHPCPSIHIRAKYESSGATRQRCWVSKLGGFGGGLVSCFQLLGTLEAIGLPTLPEHIDMFFKKRGRNPERDWLSVTEAIISLEEYCLAPQVKAGGAPTDPGKPKTNNANASSTAGSPVDVLAPTYASRIEAGNEMGGIAGVTKDEPWEGSRNNTRDTASPPRYIDRAREVPRPLPPHRSQHHSPEPVTHWSRVYPEAQSASGFHAPARVLPPIPKLMFFPALPGSTAAEGSIGSMANSAGERSPSGEPSDPLTPARALDPHNSDVSLVTGSPARLGLLSPAFTLPASTPEPKHAETGPSFSKTTNTRKALESSDSSDFEDDSSDTVEDREDVESCVPLSPHLPQLLNIGQRSVYSLQGREAAEAGSKLHSYLKCCSTNSLEYSPALRLLQDLCTRSGELPACFRLENVTFNRGELVGKGGEASVYAGQLNNQKVVVREIVMTRDFWRSPEGKKIIKLIHREAITHSLLDHPNIIPFLGVYSEHADSPPMVVLPFMERGSLSKLLRDEIIFGVEFTWIIIGIGRALLYLHARKPQIIHGDLHPDNILIDNFGNALVCDFGLSRIHYEVTRTQTNIREGGRLRYLAPELLSGEMFRTSVASDIFSLAMTFLHVWTRNVPFAEISREQKAAAAIRKGRRPNKPTTQIGLPSYVEQEFWSLIVMMWAQEAPDRPLTADVQECLEVIFRPLLELCDKAHPTALVG